MTLTVRDRASARKSPETDSTPPAPQYVATMTRAEMRAEIRTAIAEHLSAEPAYVDDAGLARRLDTGLAVVRRLALEGAPHVYVGDRRRWHVATIDQWLATRGVK